MTPEARSGRVTGREIKKNRDGSAPRRLLQVELTSPEDVQTVEHLTEHGEDSSPPDGAEVVVVQIGSAWKVAVASGGGVAPAVSPGEKKIYATAGGLETVVASIYLKDTGEIEIENAAGVRVVVGADGTLQCDATNIQLNGSGERLTMWQPLDTAIQALVTALNSHTHGSGPTPDQTFSIDLSGSKADTLRTDG